MHISIENIRTLADAEFDLSGDITLIGGNNGVGKSTIAAALGAVLARDAKPFTGTAQRDGECFTGPAAKRCSIVITDGAARLRGLWATTGSNRAEIVEEGDIASAPRSSRIVAGLDGFMALDQKGRAETLAASFKIDPLIEDLAAELIRLELATDDDVNPKAEKIWKVIDRSGWDAASELYADKAKEARGAWNRIAGETWGEKKGEAWAPAGWRDELDRATDDELTERHRKASAAAEKAAHVVTASKAQREELQEQARQPKDLERQLEALDADAKEDAAELANLEARLKELRRPAYTCPECNAHLVMSPSNELTKAPDDLDVVEGSKQVDQIEAELAEARKRTREKQVRSEDLVKQAMVARAASEKLKKLSDTSANLPDSEELRLAERQASADLQMFRKKAAADKEHRRARSNKILADILSPKGLRMKTMEANISDINAMLEARSKGVGLGIVSLGDKIDLMIDGRPYRGGMSSSERWLAEALLQIVLADAEDASLVILDGGPLGHGADILTAKYRGALLRKVCRGARTPVLVTCSFKNIDAMPDLAAAGLGVSYWIDENGSVQRTGDQAAMAEAAE
ncbi:MAG: AAA family ATPase [Geminicoccaceae bacterium]